MGRDEQIAEVVGRMAATPNHGAAFASQDYGAAFATRVVPNAQGVITQAEEQRVRETKQRRLCSARAEQKQAGDGRQVSSGRLAGGKRIHQRAKGDASSP